jgi:hypothetical protein
MIKDKIGIKLGVNEVQIARSHQSLPYIDVVTS